MGAKKKMKKGVTKWKPCKWEEYRIFKNSKPLDGELLDLLNLTSKRLFSKTPTRL